MTKLAFALLLAACVGTGALAQAPAGSIGVVQDVQGLVTVSQGNTMGSMVKDSKVFDGARLVTTSTGRASIRLDNGCLINLAPNQAIVINSRLDCKALVASIQPTGGAAIASGGGSSLSGLPVFFGIGAGVLLLGSQDSNKSQNSSGS